MPHRLLNPKWPTGSGSRSNPRLFDPNCNCLQGGCPQETLIGVILYILYINTIGYPAEITLQVSEHIHKYWEKVPLFPELNSSGKVLPNQNSLLQYEIVTLKKISDYREMVLNPDKTKLLICNFSTSNQFQSLLSIPGSANKIELGSPQMSNLIGMFPTF